MDQRSLYDRLGGGAAITAVVDDFVARCAGDTEINSKFARTDVPRLKAMLVEQVSMASGGPVAYTGRSMDETHRGMQVDGRRVRRPRRGPGGDPQPVRGARRLNRVSCSASSARSAAHRRGRSRPPTPLPDAYKTAPPLAAV